MDPIDAMMAALSGGDDKLQLAMVAEKQLDITLKYVQLLYYADQMEDEKLMQQLERRVKPLIDLITQNMDETVQKYQAKHGEI